MKVITDCNILNNCHFTPVLHIGIKSMENTVNVTDTVDGIFLKVYGNFVKEKKKGIFYIKQFVQMFEK